MRHGNNYRGYNPRTDEFEFTIARQPFPWGLALRISSLAGLAALFASLMLGLGT